MLPDLRQRGFGFTLRGLITAYHQRGRIGCRKCLTIEFAVRGQGELIKGDKGTGQHIFSQVPGKLLTQFSRHQFNPIQRLQVGNQAFLTQRILRRTLFTGQNHRFTHTGALSEVVFDFTRFNAEAPQLNLKIIAAKILDITVREPAAEVAGLVQARIGFRRERINQETFCGQFRMIQVTPGNAGTGDMDFPCHAKGRGLTIFIQNVDPGIGNRAANGDRAGHIDGGGNRISCGKRGGFRRAIAIDQV
ncbi:hypothetical protein Xbed_03494 [Xenorhabdus beddingii]|uniref:Uncharacterized protein n=1 Tax=Xenorhabdus beddingii TaxID=40578 RepID=A0A1Y2SCL2_9GAMM|nr:hypothetical protein Xbed_03494 [Xenorhabdus beddingii]